MRRSLWWRLVAAGAGPGGTDVLNPAAMPRAPGALLTAADYHRLDAEIRKSDVSKSAKRDRLRKLKLRYKRDSGKPLTEFEEIFAGGVPRCVKRDKLGRIHAQAFAAAAADAARSPH